MNKVYINCLSSFLPNESVDNEHIEDFLGYIEGKKSRIKSIVLKSVMVLSIVIMH